jgi:hypothetical protein
METVIVQPRIGQMPKVLEMTTLTNHIEILADARVMRNVCSTYSMPTRSIW